MSQFRKAWGNRPWSDDDLAACKAEYEAGVPMASLIERYTRTESAILNKASTKGWSSRQCRDLRPWGLVEECELVVDYVKHRMPWADLLRKYGRSDGSLANKLSRMGIRRQKGLTA